jgi:hypothetical protein
MSLFSKKQMMYGGLISSFTIPVIVVIGCAVAAYLMSTMAPWLIGSGAAAVAGLVAFIMLGHYDIYSKSDVFKGSFRSVYGGASIYACGAIVLFPIIGIVVHYVSSNERKHTETVPDGIQTVRGTDPPRGDYHLKLANWHFGLAGFSVIVFFAMLIVMANIPNRR